MGGKTSTSTSNVSIPPEVLARYNAINARAETAANKPFQAFGNNAADYVAQMNAQQAAGTNTINANTGPASAGIDPYITSYTKNVADTTGAYLKQQQEQAQSGALGTAVQSGAFGGDRAGVAAANLQQQNQMAYGKTMADIMNQGYTQALAASQADLNRGLQAGQMQLAAGTMGQQTEQAGKDAMINRFMQEQGLPYQQAQFLANIALGTGVASGSTTTSTQPIGFFQNLATGGKVDGYAEGGGVAGPVSHSKEAIGGLGYVPEPNLPIGDLMIAKPPEQQDNNGGDIVAKVLAMIGGGGKAEGGSVVRPSLPKEMGRLIPEPSEPVNFMDSRQAKIIAAIPRALLESLNMLSADGHAARAEKPIDRETIRRETYGGEKMNEFYGQVEDMKQTLDRDVLGPIASGYNSIGSGISSRLADLFGTLGDDMVQKTYQDLARESADKALRYSNEGIFPRKAATPKEIEDRKELAHLTRYASGGVAGGRHGYATDGYVGPNSREEALARYNILQGGDRSENLPRGDRTENLANDFLIASGIQPLNDNYMPPQGGVAPARPMPARPISLTPPNGVSNLGQTTRKGEDNYFKMIESPTKGQVIDYGISQGRTPTGNFMPPRGMPDRPISLTPRSGLAPTESPRPLPRPAGLAGGADIAADTISVLGNTPAATGVVAPTVAAPQTTPQTDTGEIPQGGYTPIIPLKTQLQFITKELQQPEYSGYLKQTYASPYDAATAFDSVYERSGGKGTREAGLNANDIYRAAQNGDMGNLPPNVVEAYNHFIENGMDPIQASGAAGRLMVESYANLDPNARNTIGGGYGTYGIAQHRGDRLEKLAEFAGVPLQSIIDAPVSTPEGRYYSTGANYSGGLSGTRTDVSGAPMGGVKPYEDRNAVGKFFNNPEGGLNRNALLSLLSGLGTMASSRSRSPFTAILQGLGGGAETYKDLLKQSADVAATNIGNMRNIQMDTTTYNELNGTNLTPQQYSSMVGANYQIPTGTAQPIGGDKMTFNEYQNDVVDLGGRTVRMQDDPASIQKFISDNSMFPVDSPIGRQVEAARLRLNDINNSGGMTVDSNGQQFQIPGYTDVANVQAKTVADQAASAEFRAAAGDALNSSAQQLAAVKTLESVYTTMEPGKFANVGAEASAILSALDPNNITGWNKYDLTDPAQYQIAMKGAGEIMATRLRTMPGGAPSAEIDMLSTITPTPNMQPAAVKKLLAITKADAQYRLDMYNNYDPAAHGNDVNAYMRNFADSGRTFTRYVEEAMASMPRFAGEGIEPSAAEAELIKRGYVRNSEGKLVKP